MMKENLAKIASQQTLQLTTQGRKTGKNHRVEVWFAVNEDKVYLSHEGRETDWMRNIKKNGRVFVEIGGTDFEGSARYVQDGTDESWTGKVALYEKYYGKASKEIIQDWFSLSRLVIIQF
jgi:deazaflavin-dependent oxidoreductase (nitroreductase family)